MSQKTRIVPTETELDAMLSTHLSFEINRFRLGALVWKEQQRGEDRGLPACMSAMLRESLLIHMRLMLDFFYPRKTFNPKFRDVFVLDYLPAWSRPEPAWIDPYRKKIDEQLAHLTINRVRMPPWGDKEILHINALIDEFLGALAPGKLALYDPRNGWEGMNRLP